MRSRKELARALRAVISLSSGESDFYSLVKERSAKDTRECEREKRAQVARVSPEKDVMMQEFVHQIEKPQHRMVKW